ncbi:putative bifunctional diguanylate cyclase/phosphodiesterase [Shewanella sp. 0m-4]
MSIPLLVAASLAGVTWLHSEVDSIRRDVIEAELKSIESQIKSDLKVQQRALEAQPMLLASAVNSAASAWPKLAQFSDLQLSPVVDGYVDLDDGANKARLNLPAELLANPQENTGLYYDAQHRQGYFISLQAASGSQRLLLSRKLTDAYLANLDLSDFVTQIKLAPGSAQAGLLLTDDTLTANTVTAELSMPSLLAQSPAHLTITFSNHFFSRVVLQYSLFTLILLGLSIILLLGVFFWLRLGVFKPFERFAKQLNAIDFTSRERALISSDGHGEFSQISSDINQLLSRVYQQERQSKITLESIAEAVILIDIDTRVSYLNPYGERLLKVSNEQARGKSLDELLAGHKGLSDTLVAFMQGGSLRVESTQLRLDIDTPKLMSGKFSNLSDYSGRIIGAVIALRDTTEEALLKQRLQRGVHFDSMTGLLNRGAFEQQFIRYVQSSKTLAVVCLDLEQFKLINESCGHSVGDKMLDNVAKAIGSCLFKGELLGRLGGDEFGLVIKDCSALEVAKLIKKIIVSVGSQEVTHNDTHYRVGVSAGVALSRFDQQTDLLELLKDADIACHAAKCKGSNQVHFYDSRDKDLSYQRNASKWAVRIVQAIEHNELVLYYQKIKCLSSHSRRQRLEVLLRIQEPGGRVLPPAQFIAAAERFKLIVDVDKEVIRKTFLWLSLNEPLWDDHCLSINLSGNSLGAEGMVDFILKQQKRFGIPSSCICFEITETSAIQNRSRAMKMLLDLRKRGFAFALDDFGSGFASYGYLKEMPVDYVKIDGCFVKNLVSNAKDYAIVKSINDVCRVMGIETIAEFVENQEIIDQLEIIGINYAQGYGIGRPQALESYQTEPAPEKLMV